MNTTANPNDVVGYCRTCGKPLTESNKRDVYGVLYCEDCLAARVQGSIPTAATTSAQPAAAAGYYNPSAPNPGVATLLGFIPGVGAMYNGQVAKGLVHVGIFALLISLVNSVDNTPLVPFFGIGIAGFYFYMIFDAYQTAKALRAGMAAPDHLRILQTLHGLGWRTDAGMGPIPVVPVQPTTAPVDPAAAQAAYAAQPGYVAQPMAQPQVYAVAQEPACCDAEQKIPVSAIVLIVLGTFFLFSTLGFVHLGHFFFPILLIALGVWIAFRRLAASR